MTTLSCSPSLGKHAPRTPRLDEAAGRLYLALHKWLSFREGYEAHLLDIDVNEWAAHHEKTCRFQEWAAMVGAYPRDLVRLMVWIVADIREVTLQAAWRYLHRTGRQGKEGYLADLVYATARDAGVA